MVGNDIGCHVDQAADLQYTAEAVSPRAYLGEISRNPIECVQAHGITMQCVCMLSPVTA